MKDGEFIISIIIIILFILRIDGRKMKKKIKNLNIFRKTAKGLLKFIKK